MITKIKQCVFEFSKVVRSHFDYFGKPFILNTSEGEIEFFVADLSRNHFMNLEKLASTHVFDQIIHEGAFKHEPYFKRMFDTYVSGHNVMMLYTIKNNFLIVVSSDEQSPGLYWLIVENVWKIIEEK